MAAARQPVQIRLSDAGLAKLDQIAEDWRTTRSDVIRVILGNAMSDRDLLRRLKAQRTEQL